MDNPNINLDELAKNLDETHNLYKTDKYINFSANVLLAIGEEIEKNFPGVDFTLKARIKSDSSYEHKKSAIINGKRNDTTIFDNVGFSLVINKFPYNLEIDNPHFMKLLADRASAEENISNAISALAFKQNKINTFKAKKLHTSLIGSNDFDSATYFLEDQKEHLKALESNLKSCKKIYNYIDNECQVTLANHILKFLTTESERLKELGISSVPGRYVIHNGGETGNYFATHDTLQSSRLLRMAC